MMRDGKPKRKNLEKIIQDAIINYLTVRGWYCKNMHGNLYQSGFPDIFACHSKYGIRLIEVKLKDMKGSKFTPAQLVDFPKMRANGARIWVLTSATETEYAKLFKPDNIREYLLMHMI